MAKNDDDSTAVAVMNPMALIQMAIDKDSSLERLEKLMDLQERWEAKQAAKAFKAAMVEFQGKKPELKKTKIVDLQIKQAPKLNTSTCHWHRFKSRLIQS